MKHIETIREMQSLALSWKRSGRTIALVPTMGALHAGHLSLIKCACQSVQLSGKVVVSIYVNPLQFSANEDFEKYPRDLQADMRACQEAGADAVFTPSDSLMYPFEEKSAHPELKHSTYAVEEALTQSMEGTARPTHFKGVTTIVAKLFNIVLPDYAVFGNKDFQQAAVIQRMVRDLNFPVQIIRAPIVRETDGLALSSRNAYLSAEERKSALCLYQSIRKMKERVSKGPLSTETLKSELKTFIEKNPETKMDYIEFFNPETLSPVSQAAPGVQMALAVFVGKTRLIDNDTL
ncbi:MAG: pantoate--beta-alanine ligase [Limisphaerales bacterium]|jgi:pantoate--beta-alanine ligase